MLISLRAMALAGSLPLVCGGCATTQAVVVQPYLPAPPPAFGKPVAVPDPAAGQSAKAYAAQALGALITANTRLVNDRAFYSALRK